MIWIDVKKKLPELNQPVFIRLQDFPDQLLTGLRYKEDGSWYLQNFGGDLYDVDLYESRNDWDITHWMELPKTLREEKP